MLRPMQRVRLDRPVLTGLLLGIGLGFSLLLWESVRWTLEIVFDGNPLPAFCGLVLLAILLWVIALSRGRRSRGTDARDGTE